MSIARWSAARSFRGLFFIRSMLDDTWSMSAVCLHFWKNDSCLLTFLKSDSCLFTICKLDMGHVPPWLSRDRNLRQTSGTIQTTKPCCMSCSLLAFSASVWRHCILLRERYHFPDRGSRCQRCQHLWCQNLFLPCKKRRQVLGLQKGFRWLSIGHMYYVCLSVWLTIVVEVENLYSVVINDDNISFDIVSFGA